MAIYQKSVKYVIEANLDRMTASEKQIAEYFLQLTELDDLSAELVSKKLWVSIASLSRFAKKCGFSGYREFAALYKSSFVNDNNVKSETNRLVLDSYQEILNRQYALLDESQISRIAERMARSKRVYIAGRGNSGLSAEELAGRFKWLGINAICIRDTEEMKLTTLFVSAEDMVIGLSVSGNQPDLLYLLEKSREQGSFTVLATGSTSRLLKVAVDELVPLPVIKDLNYGNLISPQFPMLLLGDMVYGAYVMQNEAAARAKQKNVRTVLYGKKE